MENLFILMFDLLLITGYMIAGIIIFILVEVLVYYTTGFNIYRFVVYHLIDKQLEK